MRWHRSHIPEIPCLRTRHKAPSRPSRRIGPGRDIHDVQKKTKCLPLPAHSPQATHWQAVVSGCGTVSFLLRRLGLRQSLAVTGAYLVWLAHQHRQRLESDCHTKQNDDESVEAELRQAFNHQKNANTPQHNIKRSVITHLGLRDGRISAHCRTLPPRCFWWKRHHLRNTGLDYLDGASGTWGSAPNLSRVVCSSQVQRAAFSGVPILAAAKTAFISPCTTSLASSRGHSAVRACRLCHVETH